MSCCRSGDNATQALVGAASAAPARTQPPEDSEPMPFLELTVPCRESEQPRYEHALEDVGALAVTMLDANADTDTEHAILEPGYGQTPLVDPITLTASFPPDAAALSLPAPLGACAPA